MEHMYLLQDILPQISGYYKVKKIWATCTLQNNGCFCKVQLGWDESQI